MPDSPDPGSRVRQIQEFLDCVIASGLVQRQRLDLLMQEFYAKAGRLPVGRFGQTVTGVSAYLISRGLLTWWQVERLRHGKTKGFFYDAEYCLLDCLGALPAGSEPGGYYLAESSVTSRLVVLEVIHPGPGKERHRILEVIDR
jgi:hypothetical protein